MEKAFEQTVIAFKLMEYCYTLKIFFKDEFKSGESAYLIPFHMFYMLKQLFFRLLETVVITFVRIKKNALDINF